MINPRLNISEITNYIKGFVTAAGVSANVFNSMPKSALSDFAVVEVVATSENGDLGKAVVYIYLFAKNVGKYYVDNTTKLNEMETKLLDMISTHCITDNYSLKYYGGGHFVRKDEFDVSGRLYEVDVFIK